MISYTIISTRNNASLTGLNPEEIGGKSIRKLFEKKDYTQIFHDGSALQR